MYNFCISIRVEILGCTIPRCQFCCGAAAGLGGSGRKCMCIIRDETRKSVLSNIIILETITDQIHIVLTGTNAVDPTYNQGTHNGLIPSIDLTPFGPNHPLIRS